MVGIPVLMYHGLEDEMHPSLATTGGERRYVLNVSQFREQMSYLKQAGFQTLLLDECDCHSAVKSVVLTFDDGHTSNYHQALPILEEFSFRAEFFITTGWIGSDKFLNPKEIEALAAAGMGIGSHGVSHSFLDDLDDANLEQELVVSRNALQSVASQKISAISAPGGRTNKRVLEWAGKAGYTFFCTSKPDLFDPVKSTGCVVSVPRVAITCNASLKDFKRIVDKERSYFWCQQFKFLLLSGIKGAIGNFWYSRTHDLLNSILNSKSNG